MIQIIVSNVNSRIICPTTLLEEVREVFKLKVKNAYYSEAFQDRRWDGYKRFITPSGVFATGMLPEIYEWVKKEKHKVKLIDQRDSIEPEEFITEVGGEPLREYQLSSLKAFFNSTMKNLPFQRGIFKEATNAGKTRLATALYQCYPEDTIFFILIHRQLIHTQLLKDFTEFLGKDLVGVVKGDVVNIKKFNVCMVNSLYSKLKDKRILQALASAHGFVVDEGHRAQSATYARVLDKMYNATIRVSMSGTPLMNKDPIKNKKQIEQFGPLLHSTTNKDLIDGGFSTPPVVTINLGDTKNPKAKDYKQEYDKVITYNRKRNNKIWKRISRAIDRNRLPLLVFTKYIDHTKTLYDSCPEEIKDKFKIGVINVNVKNRQAILDDYKLGKIDILIATHIIAEGQNMPLIKFAINAGGGDSAITIIQWVGRMLRKHKSKKKVYIEDYYDLGKYLKRHSKHRVKFYKDEKFEVKERYKAQAKKKSIRII